MSEIDEEHAIAHHWYHSRVELIDRLLQIIETLRQIQDATPSLLDTKQQAEATVYNALEKAKVSSDVIQWMITTPLHDQANALDDSHNPSDSVAMNRSDTSLTWISQPSSSSEKCLSTENPLSNEESNPALQPTVSSASAIADHKSEALTLTSSINHSLPSSVSYRSNFYRFTKEQKPIVDALELWTGLHKPLPEEIIQALYELPLRKPDFTTLFRGVSGRDAEVNANLVFTNKEKTRGKITYTRPTSWSYSKNVASTFALRFAHITWGRFKSDHPDADKHKVMCIHMTPEMIKKYVIIDIGRVMITRDDLWGNETVIELPNKSEREVLLDAGTFDVVISYPSSSDPSLS
jgi:hypothetical protein